MQALMAVVLAVAAAGAPGGKQVLSLEQVLAAATERNPDLSAARARLEQARELSRKTWSAYLPTVTAGGTYTYNPNEVKFTVPSPTGGLEELVLQRHHTFAGQVQLTQAVLAPALLPAIQNAYLAERTVELNVTNARREILFAAAQLYYGAVGLREALGAQEHFLEMSRQHEKDARVRFELGSSPEVAYLRAQIERIRAEQDALRAANAYASAVSSLATLLDRAPDFDVARPESPAAPGTQPAAARDPGELRPDVQAARLAVDLARGNRRGVQASYLPNLGLFVQYQATNVKGFTGEYDQWIAGLSLNWTLWDGGLREAQLREATAALLESQATLRATEARARDEVRRALLELESARANRVKAQEQVRAAETTATMVKKSYDLGAATYLELVDANTALLAAELAVITESLNADLAVLRVAKATGEWNP